jgi:hypothetical protein
MSSTNISKKRFTSLEDQQIVQLVNQFGRKWKIIESFMEERKANQIRERYINYLDRELILLPWNLDEDNLLLTCASRFSFRWKKLEAYFPGRTDVHLKNRFKFLRKQLQVLNDQNKISIKKEKESKNEKQGKLNEEKSTQIVMHFEKDFNSINLRANLFDLDEDCLKFSDEQISFLYE